MGEHVARAIQDALERAPIGLTVLEARTGPDELRLTVHSDRAKTADIAAAVARWPDVTVRPRPQRGTHTVHITHDSAATRAATPVRVPPDIAATVMARRAATGTSATEQVLDALAQHNAALRERNAQRRARLGLPAGAPQRRRGIGATVQLWLNTTTYEDQALDAAAADWCSSNRSHLVTELLREAHR